MDDRRRAAPHQAGTLRILVLTSDTFPPFRPAAKSIFGGEFARRGHVVDWLMRPDPKSAARGPQPFGNGTAYVAETDTGRTRWRRFRKHWLNVVNDLRVFGLLRSGDYDVVQVKDKYIGAVFALAAARLHGVPLVHWHAFPHPESSLYAARSGVARYRFLYWLRGTLQRWVLYKLIMPSAAHVFVQSEQMRRDVEAEGIPREKMTPVPSSLNVEAIEGRATESAATEDAATEGAATEDAAVADGAAQPCAHKPPEERWVVYLGTLLSQRRLDFLVRVIARLVQRHPEARLLFVGRGELERDETLLRDEARRLNVGACVRITGWLPTAQAWSYVRAADVCLSPYRPIPILKSTSPTKLIEYMAMGKPVVANEHPEQTQVVEQSGGGIVCEWDEQQFADAIARLLDRPEEARAMGEAGKRYVRAHRSPDRMADLVESTYRDILAGESRVRGAAARTGGRL